MTDDPLIECPECGGTLKRLIGAGLTPIFKGTGFYQTDYKNNSNSKIKKISPPAEKKSPEK
jgi:predicted nucleic acid-binding Zn ribbon protein